MAPLGMRFYKFNSSQTAQFRKEHDRSIFAAIHGSWNRYRPIGAKCVAVCAATGLWRCTCACARLGLGCPAAVVWLPWLPAPPGPLPPALAGLLLPACSCRLTSDCLPAAALVCAPTALQGGAHRAGHH